jgi:hypothetical protein
MTIFGPEFEPKLQVFVYLLSGSLTGGSGGGHHRQQHHQVFYYIFDDFINPSYNFMNFEQKIP